MAILRGFDPQRTVELAQRAWDLGIGAVEVPIGDAGQLPALEAAVLAGRERGLPVGAGTVLTPEHVSAAADAGAAYTIAPGLDVAVLTASVAAGMPHLPGVATPTEVQQAVRAGCSWVKAFPASVLGPAWFREIHGPFPGLRLVATGGVDGHTASQYLAAGARVVAVGSALADPTQLDLLAALNTRR
ncbi:bifunctional 4-hydroxy-2-oxoglutarate aldolase/2-dehydro-3-deoxy-phosphogluconate aldolase [Actinomadura scrupuli]|uniref:bifunctional 4-hydroxy-2-oxoglutarate aldolase/2-dehydro-3-deoxy-phosphogluconate aldolase n=1 Tax=Actinomadura scrupuli TaxID=559629 RepID=UPI003D96A367